MMDSTSNFFDGLPDEIVLAIFDKLRDAKSLCVSMCVCRRFRRIAPQADQIFLPLSIPQKKSAAAAVPRYSFKSAVMRALMKPLNFFSQMIKFKCKNDDEENDLDFYAYYIPNEILKSFQEIRALHVRLPKKQGFSRNSKNSRTFLKWKAEFGRELHSCVILGAKSWTGKVENSLESDQESTRARVMADDELKLRIVWTISCLIAASARHYLIGDTVKQKGLKMMETVVVSDESDQGRLCMNRQQIEEMRREFKERKEDDDYGGMVEHRSRLPALRMKMWYLERMELPDSGKVMEGATLVVIRPTAGGTATSDDDADMVAGAFGEEEEGGKLLGKAVRKLMVAKKCYVLEMNSF